MLCGRRPGNSASYRGDARQLVQRVNLLKMSAVVLGRALRPFARSLRTLNVLHLTSLDVLRSQGRLPMLASCDERLAAADGTSTDPA